jgi:hypothetical protein
MAIGGHRRLAKQHPRYEWRAALAHSLLQGRSAPALQQQIDHHFGVNSDQGLPWHVNTSISSGSTVPCQDAPGRIRSETRSTRPAALGSVHPWAWPRVVSSHPSAIANPWMSIHSPARQNGSQKTRESEGSAGVLGQSRGSGASALLPAEGLIRPRGWVLDRFEMGEHIGAAEHCGDLLFQLFAEVMAPLHTPVARHKHVQ